MKNIILIMMVLVFCFSIPVFAKKMSVGEYQDELENSIIDSCVSHTKSISDRYYCIMSELYGLKQVLNIYREMKTQEEKDKLNQLFKKYTIKNKNTWDYVNIEIEYRKWQKTKNSNNP